MTLPRSARTAALVLTSLTVASAAHAQVPTRAATPASAAAPALPPEGQEQPPSAAATTLAPVTITGKLPPTASIAGWGDTPLLKAPLQATVVDQAQMRDTGIVRISDLGRVDPAISDAYNSEGYIDYLTVRGFVIDNRFNYRRDGLPINAETSIPLDNKSRVDVLKGLTGMQAGTSAPGGLIDLIVKRPLEQPLSSAYIEWQQRGSVLGSVDLSRRFGEGNVFGLRLNAAAAHMDPVQHDAQGNRNLLALAGDWRVRPGTLVEAEMETSHKSQPSVPAFSLLGDRVPSVPAPSVNLNNQPWSQPVVFDATTASLRLTQQLSADWSAVAHGGTQRLRTDDRVAFPFGCTATDGTYYPDRYCPDGSFDLYDFRSDGEHRHTSALDLSLHGKLVTGPAVHAIVAGAQRTVIHNTFPLQVNNFVGTGNVDGTAVTPQDPTPTPDSGSSFSQRSNETYVRDAIAFPTNTTLWLGARHTQLPAQSFTSPFAAISQQITSGQIVYASWGRGVETEVAPNLPRYINANQAVPAAQSRQSEIGWKGGTDRLEWDVAAFDIDRPRFDDIGPCVAQPGEPADCTRALVGAERHRGVQASGTWRDRGWNVQAGAQWLHARNVGLQDPALDNRQPTNVPELSARLLASYALPSVRGLTVQGGATYEGSRQVLPDNSVQIPSWTRFDLGARLERRYEGAMWTWRAGVDNIFDRAGWREAPYQYSHAYLFPLAPRTFRLSLQADL